MSAQFDVVKKRTIYKQYKLYIIIYYLEYVFYTESECDNGQGSHIYIYNLQIIIF